MAFNGLQFTRPYRHHPLPSEFTMAVLITLYTRNSI
jgi:hypothetical protein